MKVDLFSVDTKKASETLKGGDIMSPQDSCKQEDVDLMNKLIKSDPQEKQFMDWLTSIENSINEESIQATSEDEQLSEIVSDFVSELKSKTSSKNIPTGITTKNSQQVIKSPEQVVKSPEDGSKQVDNHLFQNITKGTTKENRSFEEKKDKNSVEVLTQEKPLEQPLIYVAPTSVVENVNQTKMETVVAPHAIELAQQIKDQMVDRILVSSSDLNENREVILKLNPNLLAETQVSFQKVGQALQVQFMSQNTDSLKFLSVFQLDLQGYLQDELKNFRGVSVRIQQGNTDMGQPQDGRSRNPYEYQNLDDDNDPTFIA